MPLATKYRWALLFFLLLTLAGTTTTTSLAVEPEFVGTLAILATKDAATELALTEEQQAAVLKLIDDRELEALELALELKDKPVDDREAQLAPFRLESQQQGFGLLTSKQRAKFAGLIVRNLGAERLLEPSLAEAIGLTAEQRSKLSAEVGKQQSAENPSSDKEAMQNALLDLLTAEQRALVSAPLTTVAEAASPTGDSIPESPVATEPGTARPVPVKTVAAMPPARNVPNDGKLYFNFRYQPWKDVLDWFAEQANLSLTLNEAPEGTFNYVDTRGYTPAEAIDVLNSVLLTKGYTLVQHQRMLVLANIADGIPANLVPNIALEELDARGQHELVSVLFPLQKMTAVEAENEIKKLLGPQGSVVTLAKAQQIQVTETAGRLRTIRKVIEAVEGPTDGEGRLRQFTLQHISTAEALPIVRRLLNIPDETDAAADGSLRLSADLTGQMLLATGKEHRLAQLAEILEKLDTPTELTMDAGPLETPQLEVYSVPTSDPTAVLQVLQTLLAGQAEVRLALDPKTGNLVALARPSQHATIRATIEQMQRDGRRIEAFPLQHVDPQAAVLAINKLFGVSPEGVAPASAPTVDADPISRTLLVRASEAQLKQIENLLAKMGEAGGDGSALASESRGNVRVLPLTGRTFRSALDQMEQIWPTVRGNKIRVVTPSSTGAVRGIPDFTTPSFFPFGSEKPAQLRGRSDDAAPDSSPVDAPPADSTVPDAKIPDPAVPAVAPANGPAAGAANQRPRQIQPGPAGSSDRSTQSPRPASRIPVRFASEQVTDEEALHSPPDNLTERQAIPADSPMGGGRGNPDELPEIVVAPGPNGILIASDDLEALDEFEELLTTMATRTASGREFAVFYLKHAKALQVAETLKQIFGGGSGGDDGGGGLMGDLAGAALGDLGGGLLGSLLGGGGDGGGFSGSVGAVDIVPDTRLNALITRGKPADLDTLEQLLTILDQVDSPEEVLASPKPRLIPVLYTSAEEVANVVRQVYADRIAGGANAAAAQRPSPQDFIRALRGGRDRGGSQGGAADEPTRMTIGVDGRSNSLIVSAPQSLFTEVELLVKQLDKGGTNTGETTRVITLKRSNPQAISQALTSVLGPAVQSGTTNLNNGQPGNNQNQQRRSSNNAQSSRNQGSQNADPAAEFQQRIEFMNRLREQMGGGGRSRSGRGGGGR